MDGKEEEATQRMQDLIVKSCEYKYEPGCVALKVRRRRKRGGRGIGGGMKEAKGEGGMRSKFG